MQRPLLCSHVSESFHLSECMVSFACASSSCQEAAGGILARGAFLSWPAMEASLLMFVSCTHNLSNMHAHLFMAEGSAMRSMAAMKQFPGWSLSVLLPQLWWPSGAGLCTDTDVAILGSMGLVPSNHAGHHLQPDSPPQLSPECHLAQHLHPHLWLSGRGHHLLCRP